MKPYDRCQSALLSIPIDFDLAYLILLTENGMKPLSRWEGIVPGGIEEVMAHVGLQFAYVRRRLQNGGSSTEFIFSKSDAHLDLYLRHFDDSTIDKTVETLRIEGFLFGFPPCCVESFAHHGYTPNGLDRHDQQLLFHWACPGCRVTSLLLPQYRSLHGHCSELLAGGAGRRSLLSQTQKEVAKKVLAAVSMLGVVATGAALYSTTSAQTHAALDGDLHWLPLPMGTDIDGDFLPDADEPYLGVQVNNPDTDGDGELDGVDLAHAAYAIYSMLPHQPQSDTPYVVDHMLRGIETCNVCGTPVNMGHVEIFNPLENLALEVPYIALHYLEHGSYRYAGDVHGPDAIHVRELKAVLESDGTAHRLPVQGDNDGDGLADKTESRFGCQAGNPDSDGDGVADGVQLARQLWTEIEALPQQVSTVPYRVEHQAKGIETCEVCGLEVNMGYVEIINPAEDYSLQLPFISLHYLQHGSFVARGSTHHFEQYDPRTLHCVLHSNGSMHLLPVEDDTDADGLTSSEETHWGTRPDVADTDGDGCVDGAEISRALAAAVDSLPRSPQSDRTYRIDMQANGLEECEICGEVINMGFVEIVNPTLHDSLAIPYVGLHAMQHAGFAVSGTVHDGRTDPVGLAALLEFGPFTSVPPVPGDVPAECALLPCYPNPFNPHTTMGFKVLGLESRWVRLAVYDVLGHEVTLLVNEKKEPGIYEVAFDGSDLSCGVYLCRMQSGDFVQARRLVLLK
jgi:hypothetical protein